MLPGRLYDISSISNRQSINGSDQISDNVVRVSVLSPWCSQSIGILTALLVGGTHGDDDSDA